jgi:hypothetical protein
MGACAACASEPLLDGQKVIRFSQAAHAYERPDAHLFGAKIFFVF